MRRNSFILLIFLIFTILLSGCSKDIEKSKIYRYSIGEYVISVSMDVSQNGYELVSNDDGFYVIETESDNIVLQSAFLTYDGIEYYKNEANISENNIMESRDEYTSYKYIVSNDDFTECDFIVDFGENIPGVILGSISNEDLATEAFSYLSFSIK